MQISSYAGLLLSGGRDGDRQAGRAKSLLLLLGRLLMASLFLFVGITQAGGSSCGWGVSNTLLMPACEHGGVPEGGVAWSRTAWHLPSF